MTVADVAATIAAATVVMISRMAVASMMVAATTVIQRRGRTHERSGRNVGKIVRLLIMAAHFVLAAGVPGTPRGTGHINGFALEKKNKELGFKTTAQER